MITSSRALIPRRPTGATIPNLAKHIGTTALYCDVSDDTLRKAVELV